MGNSFYIAHVRKSDGTEQALKDHLNQSAELARGYGESVGLATVCYLAGLLHDAGKFSNDFQEYLRKSVDNPGSTVRGSVDHSTAGGRLIYESVRQTKMSASKVLLAELIGNCIISHHSGKGLQDFIDGEGQADSAFLERVVKKELPEYEEVKKRFFDEIINWQDFEQLLEQAAAELIEFRQVKKLSSDDSFFLLKFVYSCLLDADRTNTRCFEENTEVRELDAQALFLGYQNHLETHVEKLNKQSPQNTINDLRQKMSDECKLYGKEQAGIYSLSIPTGGGKTLASLRFALEHALKHKKKRIIYIVPFTTIIEQNAATVRGILKDDVNIIEHHSNIIQEPDKDDQDEKNEEEQALMRDNWEAPIIFTTMVQFLNTIYSKGTRNPRRFHNLQDSVLIFDEVQSVPVKCTNLFVASLNYLKKCGNTTSILCTATQPSLEKLERELEKDAEIIRNLSEIQQAFKRVAIHDKIHVSGWNIEQTSELCQEIIEEKNSLLVILNTKSAVLKLYKELEEKKLKGITLYHLSTAMCPENRRDILKEIIEKLEANKPNEKIICVTTQLIEAGVDISFESVIRSAAGLDSIAQAAGRCNRHGETKVQPVYLINLNDKLENLKNLREIAIGKKETLRILDEIKEEPTLYSGDIFSAEAQFIYFQRFFKELETELGFPVGNNTSLILDELIGKNIKSVDHYERTLNKKVELLLRSSPKTIAKYFEVIDSPTTAVLVPYGEGIEIIGQLNGELQMEQVIPLIRKAQAYTVNLYNHELAALEKSGSIFRLFNGEVLALNDNAYSREFGVDLTALAASDGLFY
ncbi:CRISPR-associated helicase/endonuclease Cas3 [Enterococcus sp. JM4C]|uniref:CRISPR-associated helicase Cas3' n=1 Tax=Candidatus Enterococcus huntleyi TaxID=1857217 RepID=UPI001379AAC5|nr:CRISPR-associated helicase Cas3' [Enterococcus sp. JM4C]KAF1296682.1 CRISPR-associated helicase/endonuclease Cas3 [Enterococcus sp. JM4C]